MEQLLKETVCDYATFIDNFAAQVKDMMGEDYIARIIKVTKNNALELDSLVLMKEGRNFAPNIYLLPYYESYMEGTDITELATRVCAICNNCTSPVKHNDFTYHFEAMKPNIIYRLVNYEMNKKLLNQIPHLRYLDLAVTFHCLVHDDHDGIGTIRITNEHLQQWNASVKDLNKLAISNTNKLFPPVIRSMEEVIRSMFREEYPDDLCNMLSDEAVNDMLDSAVMSGGHRMYILSNTKGINGATSLLYKNTLRNFSEQIRSDLYILPSSIHEVILVPYDKSISMEALVSMVQDVNRTQVSCDEVLSDSVYFYSRENNAITM